MPLENILPHLAALSLLDIIVYIVGIMGSLALSYAVLLEAEKSQDAALVVGTASLFVYGLVHNDKVIMFAMGLMFLVAGRELIQIMRGKHHHNPETVDTHKK